DPACTPTRLPPGALMRRGSSRELTGHIRVHVQSSLSIRAAPTPPFCYRAPADRPRSWGWSTPLRPAAARHGIADNQRADDKHHARRPGRQPVDVVRDKGEGKEQEPGGDHGEPHLYACSYQVDAAARHGLLHRSDVRAAERHSDVRAWAALLVDRVDRREYQFCSLLYGRV